FVGVGQMMGRAFTASTDRLLAYIFNIGGSLGGVAGFALLSQLRAPAVAWFAVVAVLWVLLLERRARLVSAAALLLAVVAVGVADRGAIWSPYYKIRYIPRIGLIETNNIGHQQMGTMDGSASRYSVP